MDTISRENNNYLPVAGAILGGLALLLSIVALVKISSLNKKVPEGLNDSIAKIEMIESEARNANTAAEAAKSQIRQLSTEINAAFGQAATQIQEVRGEIAKIHEAAKAPAAKAAAGKSAAVAGPGEYVVKSGDSGAKIARANGCSLQDLMQVNPNVNWNKLSVGAKIKLPKK